MRLRSPPVVSKRLSKVERRANGTRATIPAKLVAAVSARTPYRRKRGISKTL
jgi:hypothetical protein